MDQTVGSDGVGFRFDLAARNAMLEKRGIADTKLWKTGTTLAGAVFKVGPLSWDLLLPRPGLPALFGMAGTCTLGAQVN